MPDWIVAKIEKEDVPRCAAIALACFQGSEINRYTRPPHLRIRDATPAQREAANQARFRNLLQDIAMKAVHPETGETAAIAVWLHPSAPRDEVELPDVSQPAHGKQDPELDLAARRRFKSWLEERRRANMGKQVHWYLVSLATDPAFQKQGAARALIDWGLRQAKEAGLRTMIESVPDAVPFYLTGGFRPVETITLPYTDRDEQGDVRGEREIELRVMIHE